MLGHGGELLSYALQNRIFASGHTALTVPGSGSLTTATVNVAGIAKTTDVILLTLDLNGLLGTVTMNELPFVGSIVDTTSFAAVFSLDNSDPADQTVFLNWVVFR